MGRRRRPRNGYIIATVKDPQNCNCNIYVPMNVVGVYGGLKAEKHKSVFLWRHKVSHMPGELLVGIERPSSLLSNFN